MSWFRCPGRSLRSPVSMVPRRDLDIDHDAGQPSRTQTARSSGSARSHAASKRSFSGISSISLKIASSGAVPVATGTAAMPHTHATPSLLASTLMRSCSRADSTIVHNCCSRLRSAVTSLACVAGTSTMQSYRHRCWNSNAALSASAMVSRVEDALCDSRNATCTSLTNLQVNDSGPSARRTLLEPSRVALSIPNFSNRRIVVNTAVFVTINASCSICFHQGENWFPSDAASARETCLRKSSSVAFGRSPSRIQEGSMTTLPSRCKRSHAAFTRFSSRFRCRPDGSMSNATVFCSASRGWHHGGRETCVRGTPGSAGSPSSAIRSADSTKRSNIASLISAAVMKEYEVG
mmetsp:Transcript_17498/g.54260  ORF Transcript_17498/g.54260 Transcript_17498/m.54260 type:complete len:349 (-) Transcript_17498:1195-2241(-)